MTRDELEKTLFEGESTYLDWKRDFPGELLGARGANWDTGRAKLLKDLLFEGQVWFRRGSKNTVAMRDDLRRMLSGDAPFKIGKMNDPVLKGIEDHYRAQGREPSLPLFVNRDSCLAQGYELVMYPGTRREVWVGAVGERFEHVLMLKPKKP